MAGAIYLPLGHNVSATTSTAPAGLVKNIENNLHPQPAPDAFQDQLTSLRQWQVAEAAREEAEREAARRAWEQLLARVAARVKPLGSYASNYAFGNCTAYVASRIPVPSNWGNANTWANLARSQGWTVSSNPIVGAIAQTSAGYFGHVAIVEAVNGNTVTISEMNYAGGFDLVDTRTAPVDEFSAYIY